MAEYEKDEFDELARQAGPVGVHRAPRAWWTRVLTPLVVFLVAGLAAYGLVVWNWNTDISSPEATTSVTASPTAETSSSATATPSATASASPAASPSVTATPEPVIQYDAGVVVRNGAGIAGIAAAQQTLLEGDGFTNVSANNIKASLIPDGVNVVMYSDEALADTAARVAEVLGIASVQLGTTPGGGAIEVLLATDPAA
ncbi:LytR C-terminal domain-containing protein [Demequina capsici]|uniref:LytR C-terminal domain-containing protein n=1 Tax=Demequina capsici TaxID=3075620 RepID=A0AA96FFY6_9MICO|nr:LytR C-terminal domain-containing protein [Demequina sp. PMTSA13]WNM27866.1 LytR C-terminal domain-containing protein [Demequina sp. PMTSA13]